MEYYCKLINVRSIEFDESAESSPYPYKFFLSSYSNFAFHRVSILRFLARFLQECRISGRLPKVSLGRYISRIDLVSSNIKMANSERKQSFPRSNDYEEKEKGGGGEEKEKEEGGEEKEKEEGERRRKRGEGERERRRKGKGERRRRKGKGERRRRKEKRKRRKEKEERRRRKEEEKEGSRWREIKEGDSLSISTGGTDREIAATEAEEPYFHRITPPRLFFFSHTAPPPVRTINDGSSGEPV